MRMTLAGTPTTCTRSSTFFVTTDPAPIKTPEPICISFKMIAPIPIYEVSPIRLVLRCLHPD